MLQNHRRSLEHPYHLDEQNCMVMLDMLSEKLHQQFDLNYQTLLPLIDDVRREYFCRTHQRPYYIDRSIIFDQRVLLFERTNLMLDFLCAMIDAPLQRLSRDEIIVKVYDHNYHSASIRKQQSLHNAAGKLVARARKVLRDHLDDAHEPKWQWLIYDGGSKQYILVRPRLKILKF